MGQWVLVLVGLLAAGGLAREDAGVGHEDDVDQGLPGTWA